MLIDIATKATPNPQFREQHLQLCGYGGNYDSEFYHTATQEKADESRGESGV